MLERCEERWRQALDGLMLNPDAADVPTLAK